MLLKGNAHANSLSSVRSTQKHFILNTTPFRFHRPHLCAAALEGEVAKLGQAVAAAKSEYGSAAARLEELRQRLKECDREIGALAAEKANLACQLTDLAVEKKKLQHKYRTFVCCCCYFCWQNHFDVCALNVSHLAFCHGHQCCARKGVEKHTGGLGGSTLLWTLVQAMLALYICCSVRLQTVGVWLLSQTEGEGGFEPQYPSVMNCTVMIINAVPMRGGVLTLL